MGNHSEILNMKAFICLLVTLIASSEAKSAWKMTFGETKASCPTVATKSTFDIAAYLGDWYQVQGIPSFFQPADAHCVRATYTKRDDTSINVRNIGIFSNEDKEICGHADSKDPANPAQLALFFPVHLRETTGFWTPTTRIGLLCTPVATFLAL